MAAVQCHLAADCWGMAGTPGGLESHQGLTGWGTTLGAPAGWHRERDGCVLLLRRVCPPPARALLQPPRARQYLEGSAWAMTGPSALLMSLTPKATH